MEGRVQRRSFANYHGLSPQAHIWSRLGIVRHNLKTPQHFMLIEIKFNAMKTEPRRRRKA